MGIAKFVVQVISALLGFWLLYLTFVMKESTEGKWVNRIEEMWIRIDDRCATAGEATTEVLRALARKVTALIDRVVGPKMISVRVVGISGSLSFASCFFVFGLFFTVISRLVRVHPDVFRNISGPQAVLLVVFGIAFFLASGLCLTLAVLPVLFRSPFWAWLSCIPTALILFLTYRLIYEHFSYGKQLGILVALAVSIVSDLLLLTLIRKSLAWMMDRTSVWRMIAAVATQISALCLVFVVPALYPILWRPDLARSSLGDSVFMLAIFNIPTGIASIAFAASLFVVLLHRIRWPLLSQWTYVLTRTDVLEKRKTVRWIGGALHLYGLSGLFSGSFFLHIAEKLLGE